MPPKDTKPPVRRRTAGGVVLDAHDRVLVIERDVIRDGRPLHEVRLPKGKVESGETDEQAAVREVGEESGYWELTIVADLGEQEVTFERNGCQTIRRERYYLMRLTSNHWAGQRVDPHKEEALFTPRWLPSLDDAAQLLTYPGEQAYALRAKRCLEQSQHHNEPRA
jgi:8-oxo-dGTP pyrophosphatase MutT (NUDIX family)